MANRREGIVAQWPLGPGRAGEGRCIHAKYFTDSFGHFHHTASILGAQSPLERSLHTKAPQKDPSPRFTEFWSCVKGMPQS